MNTPASDACQIPLNPDVVATVQDTPASAVVPSREAVEGAIQYFHLGSIDHTLKGKTVADMLRTLLAEVERLTDNLTALEEADDIDGKDAHLLRAVNKELLTRIEYIEAERDSAYITAGNEFENLQAERDELQRTVADQAAALAERDKDAGRYRYLRSRFDECAAELDFAPNDAPWVQVQQNLGAGAKLDELIDAALAASVSTQEKPK